MWILVINILQGNQPQHNFDKRYGVITILDALGTKGSWKDKEKMERLRNWSSITDELDDFLYTKANEIIKVQPVYGQELDLRYDLAIVSDTIFLLCSIKTTNEVSPQLLKNSIAFIAAVLTVFFPKFMKKGIYLRGSMGIGVFYKGQGKKLIAVGPTVDEVAENYESSNWIGITTNPSLSLLFDNDPNLDILRNDIFVKYDIPKKFGYEKNGWCYNWTKTVSESDILVLKQELDFGNYQKEHIPYEVYLKYKNTLDFYNFFKKKK